MWHGVCKFPLGYAICGFCQCGGISPSKTKIIKCGDEMMKFNIKPLSASIAALVLSAAFAPAVLADDAAAAAPAGPLTAAAGVATAYYWRGLQVSNGAQVWGELTYTLDSGFYGDLWVSSEGFGVGPEYDITAGWNGKLGDLGINVGAVTYTYSSDKGTSQTTLFKDKDPGDFSDAFVKLALGNAFAGVYINIAQAQSQDWVYAGYTIGKFTGSVGYQQFKDHSQLAANPDGSFDSKWDYSYADITYAATDHLSIIVSSVLNHSDNNMGNFGAPPNLDTNRAKVLAAYSLPISF